MTPLPSINPPSRQLEGHEVAVHRPTARWLGLEEATQKGDWYYENVEDAVPTFGNTVHHYLGMTWGAIQRRWSGKPPVGILRPIPGADTVAPKPVVNPTADLNAKYGEPKTGFRWLRHGETAPARGTEIYFAHDKSGWALTCGSVRIRAKGDPEGWNEGYYIVPVETPYSVTVSVKEEPVTVACGARHEKITPTASTTHKFVVGDRVRLITKRHRESASNPVWGGFYGQIEGTVSAVRGDSTYDALPVTVKWDNSESNRYAHADLAPSKAASLAPSLAAENAKLKAELETTKKSLEVIEKSYAAACEAAKNLTNVVSYLRQELRKEKEQSGALKKNASGNAVVVRTDGFSLPVTLRHPASTYPVMILNRKELTPLARYSDSEAMLAIEFYPTGKTDGFGRAVFAQQ